MLSITVIGVVEPLLNEWMQTRDSTSSIRGVMTPLMMEVDRVSKTLGFCPEVTQLVAQEDCI
jgi:hypothetical protein